MSELEPPTVLDTFMKMALRAVPAVGSSLSVGWEDLRDRRAAHARHFLDLIGNQEQDTWRRIAENEALEVLVLQGVEIVVRSSLPVKREHLARVIARALQDNSAVLEAQLLARAYEDLDDPELRALARLDAAQLAAEREVGLPDRAALDLDEFNRRSEAIGEAVTSAGETEPTPILASLIKAGVVWPIGPLGGGVAVSRVSSFGRAMLADLNAVGAWR